MADRILETSFGIYFFFLYLETSHRPTLYQRGYITQGGSRNNYIDVNSVLDSAYLCIKFEHMGYFTQSRDRESA